MPVKLYFIRHGIAEEQHPAKPDEQRSLTPKGEKRLQEVALRLQTINLRFDLLLTSPLARAYETAVILQKAHLTSQLQISHDLAPAGKFEGWLTWLEQWQQSASTTLGLVGHQPNLSQWAEMLVWGDTSGRLTLKKAGMIGVVLPKDGSPIGRSVLFWLTSPRYLL